MIGCPLCDAIPLARAVDLGIAVDADVALAVRVVIGNDDTQVIAQESLVVSEVRIDVLPRVEHGEERRIDARDFA